MRILVIAHNHPALMPGGTETVARGLFRELRDRHGWEGLFLGAVTDLHRPMHPGTLLGAANGQADEVLVWLGNFERFSLSQPDCYGLASLAPMLQGQDPDVVHIHHKLMFGVEIIDLIRRAVPRAKLVFTAHDYFALCAREGELLTADGRLCQGPSLDACRRCFPDASATDFVLRDLAVRDALADVDQLVVPSEFARQRYIANGYDAARIAVVPNGTAAVEPAPLRPAPDGRRDRFGFFGHINPIKGARVLLAASTLLSRQGVAHQLSLHGGTAWQNEEYVAGFKADLEEAPAARHFGVYDAAALPRLMAKLDWVVMPSIWWENAPLVLLEAFRHGRPVICGDIGGMAETVRHEVDGLHVPVNDPAALAAAMRRAVEEPGLWERLRQGIRPPLDVAGMTKQHIALYRRVMAGRPTGAPRPRRDRAAIQPRP